MIYGMRMALWTTAGLPCPVWCDGAFQSGHAYTTAASSFLHKVDIYEGSSVLEDVFTDLLMKRGGIIPLRGITSKLHSCRLHHCCHHFLLSNERD
ncbi:hypothetical protein Mapa_007519 [Marchantia paleacea]|nr:hypothetical protein Mapa_007519 [Marchantia paleacea]